MIRIGVGVLIAGAGAVAVLQQGFVRSTNPTLSSAVDSIASPAGRGSSTPHLAVAPDGTVYMSWLEPGADSTHSLRFATLKGTSWSAPRTISSSRNFFVNWADFPSIEVLGSNHLAAHWLQRGRSAGTYAYGVRVVQSRDNGATWSPELTPHRDTSANEHGFVSLWKESGAGAGAVWLDGRRYEKGGPDSTDEMMLLTTAISSTGALSPEIRLDERVCDCCQTAVVVTAAGPIIAYRDRSPDEIRDISIVRRVNGKWLAPTPVSRDNWKIAACPVNGPALDASGARVALAWFTAARDTARVKIAFSTNSGATFGKSATVDSGNPAGRVDVRLLKDGSALVTWIERTGGDGAAMLVRRVYPTGKAGRPVTIATSSAARASGFPRMVLSGESAYFAWTVPGRPSAVRVARASLSELR